MKERRVLSLKRQHWRLSPFYYHSLVVLLSFCHHSIVLQLSFNYHSLIIQLSLSFYHHFIIIPFLFSGGRKAEPRSSEDPRALHKHHHRPVLSGHHRDCTGGDNTNRALSKLWLCSHGCVSCVTSHWLGFEFFDWALYVPFLNQLWKSTVGKEIYWEP